jgi:4-amino-4-deoxy-L-arabinose transferase-like glycosyltransferase
VRGPSLISIVALALALWAGEHALRGLWEPDEARYAYVAEEMARDEEWFVMHLHGEPYPDKPPLMFWLMRVIPTVTGNDEVGPVAARFPSLLGAVASLWVVGRLLARWVDGRAAWRGVLVLATSHLFWKQGGWGQIDMLLCGLEMLGLYCFFGYNDASADSRRTRFAWLLGAYTFAGLAVLAKGPVGLIVPLGIYVTSALAAGEGRGLRAWHWCWGIPLAVAIPGMWLAIAWWQGAQHEYFEAMLGVKSFGRAIDDASGHGRPLYYYLLHFPMEFLPWTLFLPSAWFAMGAGTLRRRLTAWALFVFVLFSLFHGKRQLYILGMYPAAAMIVAVGWPRLESIVALRKTVRAATWLALLLPGIVAAAALAAVLHHDLPGHPAIALPTAAVGSVGCWLASRTFRREGWNDTLLRIYAGTWLVLLATVGAILLPAGNAIKAPLFAEERAARLTAPDEPIHLLREQLAIVPLYAKRPGRLLRDETELTRALEAGTVRIVVAHVRDWEKLPETLRARAQAVAFKMGSKRLVWAEFSPQTGSPEISPAR